MEMSELFNSKTHFTSLLISDLFLFCSFILSHPLYFSYFIFFSPYLVKVISFLSPLFITTFLVLLAFLTGIFHEDFSTELGQKRVSHLLAAYSSVLEKLRSKKDDRDEEFHNLEDIPMYEIVFGSSITDATENPVEVLEEKPEESHQGGKESILVQGSEENSVPAHKLENSCAEMEERRMENFLKILDEFERMSSSNVDAKRKVVRPLGSKPNKVVEKLKAETFKNGSEATGNNTKPTTSISADNNNDGKECNSSMVKAHSQRVDYLNAQSSRTLDCNIGSYGSMRKEKEWKRTLACKLFEERHNRDGVDGMDSLWEAYENESSKPNGPKGEKPKKKNKNKSAIELKELYGNEDEEEIDGQLCCLQALKLSAGKMNMGMGRPNLVKITKAIKGFGWLHHVTKHSKKVHNNNGDRY